MTLDEVFRSLSSLRIQVIRVGNDINIHSLLTCFTLTSAEFCNNTDKTMGISYSTARWVAPASFLIDFAAQNYGYVSQASQNLNQTNICQHAVKAQYEGYS